MPANVIVGFLSGNAYLSFKDAGTPLVQFRASRVSPLRIKISKQEKNIMAADSATYEYDSVGRLKKITFANGTVVEYFYDDMGNRTSVVTTCSGGGC